MTGKRVFDGKSAVEISVQHVTTPAPRPSAVSAIAIPEAIEAIVMRCLAKCTTDRFASAAELAAAFSAFAATTYDAWPVQDAQQWWLEFHGERRATLATSLECTRTMTVELGTDRAPVPVNVGLLAVVTAWDLGRVDQSMPPPARLE